MMFCCFCCCCRLRVNVIGHDCRSALVLLSHIRRDAAAVQIVNIEQRRELRSGPSRTAIRGSTA